MKSIKAITKKLKRKDKNLRLRTANQYRPWDSINVTKTNYQNVSKEMCIYSADNTDSNFSVCSLQ